MKGLKSFLEDFNLFSDNFLLKKEVLQPIIRACTGVYVIIVFISWLQERCSLHEKPNVPKGNAQKVLGGMQQLVNGKPVLKTVMWTGALSDKEAGASVPRK